MLDEMKLVEDKKGNPIEINGFWLDITDRKNNQERINNLNLLLDAVTSSTKFIIATIDRDCRFTYFNKEHQENIKRITGKDNKIGMSIKELFSEMPNPQRMALELWGRVLNGETVEQVVEFGPKHYKRFYRTRYAPILDKKGKIVGAGEVSNDITEIKKIEDDRKKHEEQIKKLNESLMHYTIRLKAANKEVEAFSYSVSHDLRAPLRSIDGFSEALLEDYADKLDETGVDYLNRVRNASQRMSQLIDGMLHLSHLSRKEMFIEKVDMGELAKSIIDNFRKENSSRNVDFKVQDDLVAEGDKNLLQILLENLLGNAWKFTSKKSIAKIEFGKTEKENKAVFFIKDNGVGFNSKYSDKLFVPFQRLHDTEFQGDGIGLGIVSRVIRRHGGQIWAEGETGKGAIFYFIL